MSISISSPDSSAKISPIQSPFARAMARNKRRPPAVRVTIWARRSRRRAPPLHQPLLDQPLDQAGDIAVRHHHALRELAERHPVACTIELRHEIEARERDVETVAQPPADLGLDHLLAGEQAQPQPQLVLVVVRALGNLGLGIEWNAAVLHQISPPATASVVPVTAAACGEHR